MIFFVRLKTDRFIIHHYINTTNMKHLSLTTIFLLFGFFALQAQSTGNSVPEGFTTGSIVLPDNTTQAGLVKNNLKKNGEVIFLSTDGKKTKYTASQITGLTIENQSYIVVSNAFYKVVTDGAKIRLLRKASNSSGIQYNGSEAVAVNTGEGSYDDYFIQTVSTKKLQLVRKKDFAKIFISTCADCTALTEELKANKLGFTEIEQAVALYNACIN